MVNVDQTMNLTNPHEANAVDSREIDTLVTALKQSMLNNCIKEDCAYKLLLLTVS